MGNNNLKTTNDVLIKVDQNNLIYIDPNTVLSDGTVQPRSVDPENLVMYVNLEADLVPRTVLTKNDNQNTLLSIAGATINFMQNKNGKDYDTTWTDAYTNIKASSSLLIGTPKGGVIQIPSSFRQNDESAQSFGITDISIEVKGANFIPRVVIKFVDVRGKTLFESPPNSPYAAFFHLPWPIFYLTVKGYYGKAIKYRLHLIKFNSRYNSSNGNFEIECNFVGSTYAYLADISLSAVLNAAYFHASEDETLEKYNEETKEYDVKLSKTSKGYRILKSVFQEYMNKGLFSQENMPVRTLKELIALSGRMDKILERQIFPAVINHRVVAGIKSFEEDVESLLKSVEAWKSLNLRASEFFTQGERTDPIRGSQEDVNWYFVFGRHQNTLTAVTGATDSLQAIITNYVIKLEKNEAFGEKRNAKEYKDDKIQTSVISCDGLKDFKKFYRRGSGQYGVDIDGLFDEIYVIRKNFISQRIKIENEIEVAMNDYIRRDKTAGFGFEPTIRNIIGIILANAETYVRLMKDVHERAFARALDRQRIIEGSSDEKKETGIITDSTKVIYPWPEVKAKQSGGKELVIMYPGCLQLADKLQAYDRNLWPEVDFVENFYSIGTRRVDTLADNVEVNYVFDNTVTMKKEDISVLTNMMNYVPYTDKSLESIIYEIYERAKYTTSLTPYTNESIRELAGIEFENLKEQISEDIDVIETLKRNVTNYAGLISQMSTIKNRYPYYEDQHPTISYIQEGLERTYSIQKYNGTNENRIISDYPKTSYFINNYQAEDYRQSLYPFNSSIYTGYLGYRPSLRLNGVLQVNVPNAFISSPLDPSMWVRDGFKTNIFTNTIKIGGIDRHILNTPYFHKQLYNDFLRPTIQGKYVGSAYLFLNSLPFKDLDETIIYTDTEWGNTPNTPTLMSTIFKEIASSHYIPYYLMLKWGSIYHRYKTYINDGVDIINNVAEPIDGRLYFDDNYGVAFDTINDINTTSTVITVDRNLESDIGIHPYYESIFHQIVNGYSFLDITSSTALTSTYVDAISTGKLRLAYQVAKNGRLWTSFIDNSKFDPTNETYTILPSNGNNSDQINDFNVSEQENFRLLWDIGTTTISDITYSGYTLPRYNEYFSTVDISKEYAIDENYRKIIDLIAVFEPNILEAFELAFLDFASEKLNAEMSYNPYQMTYAKFQDILKAIVTVNKNANNTVETYGFLDNKSISNSLHSDQISKLEEITGELLSNDHIIKFSMSNPREYNNNLFGGFTNVDVKYFSVNPFNLSEWYTNEDKVQLYLGEDMDGYYYEFFLNNDIEPSEENIKLFRPLVYAYSGARIDGKLPNPTKENFIEYVKVHITQPYTSIQSRDTSAKSVRGPGDRLTLFLDSLIRDIQSLDFQSSTESRHSFIKNGYNDDNTIKLETYNYFKSFNDKWTAGNSIGQRTLMEEFLFLDKANRDIGNDVFLSMDKIVRLGLKENANINLYSAISRLIQDTGFDIRALPAYVNFYGTNFSTTSRIIPSKSVAQSIFGSYLDIDYQESSPKIVLQYIGPTSKHPEMSDVSKTYLFKNDGFDPSDPNNNPIIVAPDVFTKVDFAKSNKAVAFEVSFGDQNQSIFKGVELDQSTIKNTSESFILYENLGRTEGGGAGVAQVDISLFDIYRQASYQCEVTAMGNVMIQPTMYFYLKNIPMFRGTYWITEVQHTISPKGIETKFKGTRIPREALPNPEDSFLSSYRSLFDKLIRRAELKIKEEDKSIDNVRNKEKTTTSGSSVGTVNSDTKTIPNEVPISTIGYTAYGIPYNGAHSTGSVKDKSVDTDIKLVRFMGKDWLRATVIGIGGTAYPYPANNDTQMDIFSPAQNTILTWGTLKNYNTTQDFYFSKFDLGKVTPNDLISKYTTTEFLNPAPKEKIYPINKSITVPTIFNSATNTYQGPVHVGPLIYTSDGYKDTGYGIALSQSLMKKLHLYDGDIVYFKLY